MSSTKIYFVYKTSINVLSDYLQSLNIFDNIIEINDINKYYNNKDIFVFGQMWLDIDSNVTLIRNPNFIFMNVEMLTEIKRYDHICKFIKHNITIIDYSEANINIMKTYMQQNNLKYEPNKLLWFPYQFNEKENNILINKEKIYKYDVGMINAYIPETMTHLDYKRNKMWNLLNGAADKNKWNIINIVGWGEERDKLIKECKIIINIHHFDCFNIFEHIRCDRLIFSNKIIISDKSYQQENLDINKYVIWEDFDNIINKTTYILDNFNTYNIEYNLKSVIENRKKILEKHLLFLKSD